MADLSTNNHDARKKLPETRQSLIAGSIVPEQCCCALQAIDKLHDAFHV